MTRIASTFRRLDKANGVAVIPYLPIGCPDVQTGRSLLPVIGRQGADLIALGTLLAFPGLNPTSSPPQTAASLDDCLSVAAEARRTNEVPLVLVSSLASAHTHSLDSLVAGCAHAGVDGLLLSDLPLEDFATFAAICADVSIDPIPSISASLPAVDLNPLVSAGGFVYCPVSNVPNVRINELRTRVIAATGLPLVIGISGDKPGMLPGELAHADGILAASGLAALLASHPQDEIMLEASDYIRTLKDLASHMLLHTK